MLWRNSEVKEIISESKVIVSSRISVLWSDSEVKEIISEEKSIISYVSLTSR